MKGFIKLALLLAIVAAFLFGYVLNSQSGILREFQAALLSVEWMLLACITIWCGSFIFLTFRLNDLPLIGLLLIAVATYFIGYAESSRAADAIILLAGVTLGRGAQFLLQSGNNSEFRIQNSEFGDISELRPPSSVLRIFLIGLILLLAFSSWWHLDLAGAYHGLRWMGLWNNPNIYGMLMGAGVVLAIGLRAGMKKEELRMKKLLLGVLLISAGMMTVGLFFSYSRGAWVGTAVGLLYLAKVHGKLKWKYVVIGVGLLALGTGLFWGRTADTDAWYLKRLDLSRPSAQHRVSAWRGAVQMMRDHPLGVGWNKAVETYDKNYSPPENGAAALTMNSYLMLGTELGLPGLVCFVSYVALCLKSPKPKVQSPKSQSARGDTRPTTLDFRHWTLDATATACRAGAVMLLVAFWFDGGLFTLATASVFWILLELGSVSKAEGIIKNEETEQSLVTSAPTP